MGAQIFSFPFRLTAAGNVATVDQDSEQADAEQIAALCLTRIGERPFAPGFGLPDPVFAGIDPGAIVNGVRLYGPPVNITDVAVTPGDDPAVQQVTVQF